MQVRFVPLVPLRTRFSLVTMFAERTEYERVYRLPFNAVGICLDEDPSDPSTYTDLLTGVKYEWRKWQVGFLSEGTPTLYKYSRKNLHLAIHFHLELYPGIDLFSGLHERGRIVDRGLAKRAERIFEEKDELKRGVAVEEFALHVVQMFWPGKRLQAPSRAQRFTPALEYARDHVSAGLGVKDLSRAMHESDGHFARTFRQALGLTPKKHIEHLLVSRASALLLNPAKPVKEVAGELGFSSEFNFSRFFKRLTGVNPRAYRHLGGA